LSPFAKAATKASQAESTAELEQVNGAPGRKDKALARLPVMCIQTLKDRLSGARHDRSRLFD